MVNLEYLLELRENKEDFTLVEVLEPNQYEDGHIPGAINVPITDLENQAPEKLKKQDLILVYCASYTCTASTRATRDLLNMGYEKTVDFKAGKAGWQKAGFKLKK